MINPFFVISLADVSGAQQSWVTILHQGISQLMFLQTKLGEVFSKKVG